MRVSAFFVNDSAA